MVNSKLIVVVDDEPDILELVALHLTKANFSVRQCRDGESLFRCLSVETPDLLLLDLMLPDMDGFEVCKTLRSQERFASIPIIMLTARAEETEKILGLELGADDYVTKPFSPRELVARVKAVLRRQGGKEHAPRTIHVGQGIVMDLEKFEVEGDNGKIELTATEFRILQFLASRKGRVFSRDAILEHLWGNEKMVLDRTVDVHIKHLREKLGPAGKLIGNVRGVGYKLEE